MTSEGFFALLSLSNKFWRAFSQVMKENDAVSQQRTPLLLCGLAPVTAADTRQAA